MGGEGRERSLRYRRRFAAAITVAGWLAGCSGALKSDGAPGETDAADAANPRPMCPAPAEVRTGTPCDWTGPACYSVESPWPQECGDRGGPRALCVCSLNRWACERMAIACIDAGQPNVDPGPEAGPFTDARPEADAPPCPPPEQVRNNGACTLSFLSCPSVENRIPACLGGYEPTTCHCLSRQWSCEVYGIPCPDTGVVFDAIRPDVVDAGPIREASPSPCDGFVCADAADSSEDAPDETSPDATPFD